MTIDWWTLGLQTVNLLVLVWILARFLFRPVTRIIVERQAAAHAALDDAREAREAAGTAREAAKAELARAAERRAELFAAAERDAREEGERIVEVARSEAAELRTASARQAEKALSDRKRALDEAAAALAADISERLLARLPGSTRVAGFIEGLAGAVAELPEATRARIGAESPVRLRAAAAPSEAELGLLGARIGEVLGREVRFDVKVDPALIAGLEMETPHATVRNNFRADLDQIRRELTQDD